MMRASSLLAACLLLAAAATAADPAAAVRDLGHGRLALSYPSREGVTGDPDHLSLQLGKDHRTMVHGWYDPHAESAPGDVLAVLHVTDGRVREVVLGVLRDGDPRPRADRDLGPLSADDARAFFLDLARRARGDAAEEALMAAVMARGPAPAAELVAFARDRDRPDEARRSSLFWLAVLAGEKAAAEAGRIIDDPSEDLELRTHAVFALSQLDEDRAFPLLLDVARTHPHPELRRSALIWLAEFDRDEVTDLFEEILLSGN